MERVASVIIFNDHVTKERVEAWINKLMEQGHVINHDTREYNYDHDCNPCWYIP